MKPALPLGAILSPLERAIELRLGRDRARRLGRPIALDREGVGVGRRARCLGPGDGGLASGGVELEDDDRVGDERAAAGADAQLAGDEDAAQPALAGGADQADHRLDHLQVVVEAVIGPRPAGLDRVLAVRRAARVVVALKEQALAGLAAEVDCRLAAGALAGAGGALAADQQRRVAPLQPAQALLQGDRGCARWLDDYLAFAAQAAPMTPLSFHQAAGLFLVSTAIARRLALPSGIGYLFPNLFALQIAPPAVYKKTSGLNLVSALLETTGLEFLLLPQSVTPQSLMSELSLYLPPAILNTDEAARQVWLLQRAFAAQRAWLLDEAAGLLESFRRDYNSGLIELVLQMLRSGSVEAIFHSAYDRFGLQSYKVAMLLAAMDTSELPW